VHNFRTMFISFLYMFRTTMCPSSGEITVSMRHFVIVTLCGWLSGMQSGIDTVISPDDGHIVTWKMQIKEINILRKLCTKLVYLQDSKGTFVNPRVVTSVSMPLTLKSFLKTDMNITDVTSLIIVKLLRINCYRCQFIFMSLSSLCM
jgi:hypothetical protein